VRCGYSNSPSYGIWKGIITRCTNPKSQGWKAYGGSGVKICRRWRDSFAAFIKDLGERPSPNHSVGRFGDVGPYAPGNCAWQTPKQQKAEHRKKAGISPTAEVRKVALWFTSEQLNKVAQVAKRDGRTSSYFIRQFVNQGLARHARKAA
jgi:hypothetical protein